MKLKFIAYGFVKGTLFDYNQNCQQKAGFMIEEGQRLTRNNHIVYGALFFCENFEFYGSILDGLNRCTYSILGMNHPNAMIYRKEIDVTILHFETLWDLAYLHYREGTQVKALAYFGNPNHNKLKNKVYCKANDYKVADGIFARHFKQLFMEVSEDAQHIINEPKNRI